MFHDEQYDLIWADPPPKWVAGSSLLLELWNNPIFQRRFVLRRLVPFFGPRKAFFIGLGLSLVLNLIMLKGVPGNEAVLAGLGVSVGFPAMLMLAQTSIRVFATCLVATPVEFRSELGANLLGPILATPLSDSKLFYAECLSGLFRSLGAIEELVAMLGGLALSWLIVMGPGLYSIAAETGKITLWYVFLIVVGLAAVGVVLMLPAILGSLAAGLYSVNFPLIATTATTFVHVSLIFLGSNTLGFWLGGLAVGMGSGRSGGMILFFVIVWLVHVAVMGTFIYITGRLGVLALARARRPGYYEPERSTAAGLFLREEQKNWHMGKQI